MDLSLKALTWMALSAVLFVVVTPGVLLTVPSLSGVLSVVTPSIPTSTVIIHAIVFAVLLNVAGRALKKAGVMGRKSRSSPRSSPKSSSPKK
jgi:hypothetical protein